jgi:hypothetical protein
MLRMRQGTTVRMDGTAKPDSREEWTVADDEIIETEDGLEATESPEDADLGDGKGGGP